MTSLLNFFRFKSYENIKIGGEIGKIRIKIATFAQITLI